ncbi:MAG: ATP-binding protein [Bryobacteraceae bacterium]
MLEASTQTISVANDLAEISRLNEMLSQLWQEKGLPEDLEMPVVLALEEVLSNSIRHGCKGKADADIRVDFRFHPDAFEFVVSDNGLPYNPLLREDPDIHLPLEQRTPGGLGIFLVRRLADEVQYEFRDGRNQLRFRKLLQGDSAAR